MVSRHYGFCVLSRSYTNLNFHTVTQLWNNSCCISTKLWHSAANSSSRIWTKRTCLFHPTSLKRCKPNSMTWWTRSASRCTTRDNKSILHHTKTQYSTERDFSQILKNNIKNPQNFNIMTSRESNRVKDADKKRVLDDASRNRRARKALEALEQDNFHEDPHADLVMSKKLPKFNDQLDQTRSNRKQANKRKPTDYIKARYRKTFVQLLEEDGKQGADAKSDDGPVATYASAKVPPSALPDRHFCAVCGFLSSYTCTSCGARYCCIRCLGTHRDTRCLKWTA